MATKNGITGNIHSAHHHDSATKHVSGQAVYVDDINMPAHGLVVLIGQSPHAHALIRGMDLTAVEAAPGVVCVMTCLLYTSPSPRDMRRSRMPSSA